jgi:hypothetical protein
MPNAVGRIFILLHRIAEHLLGSLQLRRIPTSEANKNDAIFSNVLEISKT